MKIFGYRITISEELIYASTAWIKALAMLVLILGCFIGFNGFMEYLINGRLLRLPFLIYGFLSCSFLTGYMFMEIVRISKKHITIEKAKRDDHDLEQIAE